MGTGYLDETAGFYRRTKGVTDMYIRKCDRCGHLQTLNTLLPIFGGADNSGEKPHSAFAITKVDEFREITLCPRCEIKLAAWIFGRPKTCCDCDAKKYDPDIQWKSGDRDTKGAWVCSITHQLISNVGRDEYCPLDTDGSLPEDTEAAP